MDGYQHTDTVTHRSQLYHYTIERQARPDLPTVQDEQGVTYIDNAVTLTLSREGASPFFQRTYTKQSFAALLSSEFQKNGILAGFVYLRPVSQGLLFAATVCYPQRDSDFYEPFLVTISPEGVATVTKGNARDIEEPAHTDGMTDGGVTDADGV